LQKAHSLRQLDPILPPHRFQSFQACLSEEFGEFFTGSERQHGFVFGTVLGAADPGLNLYGSFVLAKLGQGIRDEDAVSHQVCSLRGSCYLQERLAAIEGTETLHISLYQYAAG